VTAPARVQDHTPLARTMTGDIVEIAESGILPIDLAADVTGRLPFANIEAAVNGASVVGRSAGAGNFGEISSINNGEVLRRAGGNLGFGAVDLGNAVSAVSGRLALANLVQLAALSLLGNATNALADLAAITAGSDHQVLRRSGTALGFGAVQLAEAAAAELPWTSVAHGDLTFTAQSGTWTVDSGDLAYFKYAILGKLVHVKVAITASSVSATPTELRIAMPAAITLGGVDSFGFSVYSEDGFSTQDCGQAILRAASNWLAFKPRTGGTWVSTTNLTAVITNLIGELA
jgi:hypothetical protein